MIHLKDHKYIRIGISADASELTEYAARELRDYLCLITGERLKVCRFSDVPQKGEIRVMLSTEGYEKRGFDRVRIFEADGVLVLQGENEISVLYAVYDFLQEFCDVRFFAPGKEFEYVPTTSKLAIDDARLPFEKGSAFEIRDFVNRTNSHDVFSFAVKNRINSILGCGPWVNGSDKCSEVNAALIHSFGLKVRGPGHSWKHFVPQDNLFDEHPEYFPLLNGKRTPTGRTACFSNPEVQRIFMENLRNYLRRHPYWDIFAFWAEDTGDSHYCECENCRRMSTTDWYFTIANLAAEVVAEEIPEAVFEVIAYQGTLEPPKAVRSLRGGGRNMLINCCINQMRDLFHPYANRTYTNAGLMDIFNNWQAWMRESQYCGKFMMMEYYNLCEYPDTGPCGRSLLWPLEVMQQDAMFYLSQGVNAMGAFTGFDRLAFPTPLRLWAWIRLWSNPELDLASLKDDFYSHYFGRDARRIRLFSERMEALMLQAASHANIADLEALESQLIPDNGFREDVLLCHLRFAVIVKKTHLAYLEGERQHFEAFKSEYLRFQSRYSRLLSQAVAPFPFLWYDYQFFRLRWQKDGSRKELIPGTEEMLK